MAHVEIFAQGVEGQERPDAFKHKLSQPNVLMCTFSCAARDHQWRTDGAGDSARGRLTMPVGQNRCITAPAWPLRELRECRCVAEVNGSDWLRSSEYMALGRRASGVGVLADVPNRARCLANR